MSYRCPICGMEMFYHIDYDCLICVRCGNWEEAEVIEEDE